MTNGSVSEGCKRFKPLLRAYNVLLQKDVVTFVQSGIALGEYIRAAKTHLIAPFAFLDLWQWHTIWLSCCFIQLYIPVYYYFVFLLFGVFIFISICVLFHMLTLQYSSTSIPFSVYMSGGCIRLLPHISTRKPLTILSSYSLFFT